MLARQKNQGKEQEIYKQVCMVCRSPNLRVVPFDEAGDAVRYECLDCENVGLPIEIKVEGMKKGV